MISIKGSTRASKLARICDTRRSPQPSRSTLPQNTPGMPLTIFAKLLSHKIIKPRPQVGIPLGNDQKPNLLRAQVNIIKNIKYDNFLKSVREPVKNVLADFVR